MPKIWFGDLFCVGGDPLRIKGHSLYLLDAQNKLPLVLQFQRVINHHQRTKNWRSYKILIWPKFWCSQPNYSHFFIFLMFCEQYSTSYDFFRHWKVRLRANLFILGPWKRTLWVKEEPSQSHKQFPRNNCARFLYAQFPIEIHFVVSLGRLLIVRFFNL